MRQTALITGASGGIGYQLALLFAGRGYDLVLIARSAGALEQARRELAAQYGVSATVIACDLAAPGAADEIYRQVQAAGIRVNALVNNAGFGDYGAYAESGWQRQLDMVRLNIEALLRLTRLFLPHMLEQRRGYILNLSSVAAFQPGPHFAVYYASKAFVQSFSEALHAELLGSGVSVTALCPGPTATGFADAAFVSESRLFRRDRCADAAKVAAYGFRAMLRGRPVAVPGALNKLAVYGQRLFPRNAVRAVSRRLNAPSQPKGAK